jgi:hypothetical protein
MNEQKLKPQRIEDVEVTPEAWALFEKAVDISLNSPPKRQSGSKAVPALKKKLSSTKKTGA